MLHFSLLGNSIQLERWQKWAPYKSELFDIEYKCMSDDDTPSVQCQERVIDYGYWRLSIFKKK